MIPKECEVVNSSTKVVCRDPGAARKMILNNPRAMEISKIRVDGCVPMQGERCDYLVKEVTGCLNFVELKGRNVSDGVAQLKNTITQLKGLRDTATVVKAFLICNESPSITQMQRFKPKFERDTSAKLVIRTKVHEVDV